MKSAAAKVLYFGFDFARGVWNAGSVKMMWAAAVLAGLGVSAGAQELSAIVKLAQQKSLEESGKVYPELKDENSALWLRAHQLAMAARDPGNALHALLGSPNAPMIFANMAFRDMVADRDNPTLPTDGKPAYVRVVRPGTVKSTMSRGWSIQNDEAYVFVRFMSTREFESGGRVVEKQKSDYDYVVLQIDDELLFVPKDAVEEVPNSGAKFYSAERDYGTEVQRKRAALAGGK